MATLERVDRPPRIQPDLPLKEVPIPRPPEDQRSFADQLVQLLLPLITIVGFIFVSGSGNPLAIIPMGLMMSASVGVGIFSFIRERRRTEANKRAYKALLLELREQMERDHNTQRLFFQFNYPDVPALLDIADVKRQHENSRFGPRLWERRPGDRDFGAIRLGIGSRPSTTVYTLNETSDPINESELSKDARKLSDDSRVVANTAVTLPLRTVGNPDGLSADGGDPNKSVVVGKHTIGIVGRSAATSQTYDFVRAALAHFCAFHSPTDSQVFVIGHAKAASNWTWAEWLPHISPPEEDEDPTARPGTDRMSFSDSLPDQQAFWKRIKKVLDQRQVRLRETKDDPTKASGDVSLPFILIVVDMLGDLPADSPLRDVASEAVVALITSLGPQLGASILFAANDTARIPSECLGMIEIELSTGQEKVFRYAEVGVNAPRLIGVADQLDADDARHKFASRIRRLELQRPFGADLPRSADLMQMHGVMQGKRVDTVDQLPIPQNWQTSLQPARQEWLRAPIGLISGKEVRQLVFSAREDGDGVHGMVAGTTGSGKSELLLTLIAEMAMKYDPRIVNFVLVDYKGGSSLGPAKHFPHVVDFLTNQKPNAVERMFVAIQAVMEQRQRILEQANAKDIVDYRQKVVPKLPPDSVLPREFPHLFIIVDEFAEMVKENPDFKAQLDSITRLGRALGVTLITATQRPAGAVTDQMRANMKFRICLRVETMEDSRELLRRSDAAFLPPNIPGRAYLQVGNENVELMQVARAGGPYTGPQIDAEPPVIWLERRKGTAAQARPSGPLQEAPALSDVLVEVMHRLAESDAEVVKQQKPWPDPLPAYLALHSTQIKGEDQPDPLLPLNPAVLAWLEERGSWRGINWVSEAMRAPVGLIDNPIRAERLRLTLDLTRGHAVIFGASGWGKTTFLRSVITSLAAIHSPDEMHVYILDFGGRGLDVLEALPHRAASILPSEEERVQRLLRRLESILEERNRILSEARADNLSTYNASHPDSVLPAILVVIDNFAEFKENYEGLLESLIGIAREGRAYGVHLVVTADQTNTLPGKLYSLFTERITLKLADKTEYANVVGRGVPGIDDIAGRGFVSVERMPLEFQTALPVGITEEEEAGGVDETAKLEMFVRLLASAWPGKRPEGIDILREIIPLRSLLPALGKGPERVQTILGVEDLNLEPALLDLQQRGPHFVVTGPPLCGKTTALRSWVMALAHAYPPDKVAMVLIDFQQRFFKYGGAHTLGDLPHVLTAVSEKEALTEVVAKLQYEYGARPAGEPRPEIFVIADNYDDFTNIVGPATRATEYRDMAELARKYGPEGLHFIMCGSLSIMRSMDDLMKQVVAPRYGLGLDSSDAPGALGGRVRGGGDEFPPGRGYIVKAGRMSLIQTAIPHDESDLEGSLDRWVEEIGKGYKSRARWYIEINPPPEPEPAESADKTSTPAK